MPAIRGVIPEHIRLKMSPQDRQVLGKAGWTMPEIEERQAVRLERELQEQIAGYLRLHQVTFGRSRMDRKTGYTVGWPDLSFVVRGRACFLEVKLPGRKPDPDQERVLSALEAAGAYVAVVTSLQQAIAAYQSLTADPQCNPISGVTSE